MQITLTIDLTAENLDRLKVFCEETGAKKVSKKQPAAKETPKAEAPAAEPATPAEKEAPAEENAPVKEEAPAVTKTDVRAVALQLSKAGQSDVLREIFQKFGAEKLSDVKEADYPALMTELVKANDSIQ